MPRPARRCSSAASSQRRWTRASRALPRAEGCLVLISGEAGIGKSALVRHFCDAQRERARVLWGACDALRTPRPLSPLIDIAAMAQGDAAGTACASEKPHAVFVALLEELRAVRPTIAVIEDVHWADEATLDVVRLLARRAEALGALVIVTYRESELDGDAPAAARRGRARHGSGRHAAAPAAALARSGRRARRLAWSRCRGALRADGRQSVLRHRGARRRAARRCLRPCATRCSVA